MENTLELSKKENANIFKPTMKLRWTKDVFYNGITGEAERVLQQCFIDENGYEHWFDIAIEN